MKSVWKFWCDARKITGATVLLGRVRKLLDVELLDEKVEAYHKGGHLVSFAVLHQTDRWNDFIVEVIEMGQILGYRWELAGDVRMQLDGSSNKTSISGIQAIQWMCDVQYQ